jgi:hypothetical protein
MMSETMATVNYEDLVVDFNNRLVTQLRSHGAAFEFLEMWVPDQDPVRSIQNMVEATQAYGESTLQIRISKQTITDQQIERLRAEVDALGGKLAQTAGPDEWLITITGL